MYGSEFVDLGSTIRKLMERVQLPNRKEKKKFVVQRSETAIHCKCFISSLWFCFNFSSKFLTIQNLKFKRIN